MDCTNCGAPLPAKSNICQFCNTLNETDLRSLGHGSAKGDATDRNCPRCKIVMHRFDLKAKQAFVLERCDQCFGIFFDAGELEALLNESTSEVEAIDRQTLDRLIHEEAPLAQRHVDYAPCPICQNLMHRKNYGGKSGVIIDTCKGHGVWLDGGELRQLTKWARSGGARLAEQQKQEEGRLVSQEEKRAETVARLAERNQYDHHGWAPGHAAFGSGGSLGRGGTGLDDVVRLVFRLFG